MEMQVKNGDRSRQFLRNVLVEDFLHGHYNHSLFWQMLKKDGGEPSKALATAIDQQFGSFSTFESDWTKAAVGQFGSG